MLVSCAPTAGVSPVRAEKLICCGCVLPQARILRSSTSKTGSFWWGGQNYQTYHNGLGAVGCAGFLAFLFTSTGYITYILALMFIYVKLIL